MNKSLIRRIAARTFVVKYAGPLTDVSKLRYQAVFMMGAGGSGKGFVARKWLKYMPGAGSKGLKRDPYEALEKQIKKSPSDLSEADRSLSDLNFERTVELLKSKGFKIELVDASKANIPFRLYTYTEKGERMVPQSEWKDTLPASIYNKVEGLSELIFAAPKHELPSYWRQINPDIYKEEIAGYEEEEPGYVHEMSSEMAKAYFEAALETGDPLFVDGTGTNLNKMAAQIQAAKDYGYRVSLIWVSVDLTSNQIRNATRARKVDPTVLVQQWYKIGENFSKLKSMANKAERIINANDPSDIARYKDFKDEINDFIARKTKYPNLYEMMKAEAPAAEFRKWSSIIKP